MGFAEPLRWTSTCCLMPRNRERTGYRQWGCGLFPVLSTSRSSFPEQSTRMDRGWHAISWCTVGFLSQFRDSGKGDRRPPPAAKRPRSAIGGAKDFSLVDDFGSALGGQRTVGSALDCGALRLRAAYCFTVVLVAIKGLMGIFTRINFFLCAVTIWARSPRCRPPAGCPFSDHWG